MPLPRGGQTGYKPASKTPEQLPSWLLSATNDMRPLLGLAVTGLLLERPKFERQALLSAATQGTTGAWLLTGCHRTIGAVNWQVRP